MPGIGGARGGGGARGDVGLEAGRDASILAAKRERVDSTPSASARPVTWRARVKRRHGARARRGPPGGPG